MAIDFSSFEEIDFPKYRHIVYVLFYTIGDDIELTPFYVGESSRHVGRFGDYLSANFSASTDFKIGEAVKYLHDRGYRLVIKFKESESRKNEEKQILKELRADFQLLNDIKGYNYQTADEQLERLKIHDFIDNILKNSTKT